MSLGGYFAWVKATSKQINNAQNPGISPLNEKHISDLIKSSHKKEKLELKLRKAERQYNFAKFIVIVVLGVGLFVFSTIYLVGIDKELYKDVLKIGLGFMSGAGVAGGVAYNLGKKSKTKYED